MANNPSLSEFIAQSQRGLYQSVFGGDQLHKAISNQWTTTTTGDVGSGRSIFTETYGRKVWQALNNQTRFFNAIPRTVWGNTAGWRVRTDRGANRSTPVTEGSKLPDVDVSNIEVIHSLPRIVATTFGASVLSVFNAQLEGGVGDVLAMENEHAQLDHMKEINQELLAASIIHNQTSQSGGTSFDVDPAAVRHFNPGDTWDVKPTGGGANQAKGVVSNTTAPNATTGVVTVATNSITTTVAPSDVLYAVGRGGFTSIEDIVAHDEMTVDGVAWASASGPKVYNLGASGTRAARTAGGAFAAGVVKTNNGAGRDISLNLLDDCIQTIRTNGGEPKVIIMGHDQYFKLERLLNSQQRYMGQEEYQVGVGSERTFPGTQTGLVLATYMGIPILPDADVAKSTLKVGATEQGSNVLVLDTDYIEMAVAQPTQYIENRDYFAVDQLTIRGLLYTMGEMRCRNFITQAKIMDLNA